MVLKGRKGNVKEKESLKRNLTSGFLINTRNRDTGSLHRTFQTKMWLFESMAKFYIKNMVCDRCKAAVKKSLDGLKINYKSVELGEVETDIEPTTDQLNQLKTAIESQGFEWIETRNARVVSQIKKSIMDWVRNEEVKKTKMSIHLSETLHKDYASISNLFSEIESTTIEQYFIHQKIELTKELLVYDELSLTQIADRLGYSSVAHLSNQFKKVTGLTPKHFKNIGAEKRVSLDKV
jgi:AraC-like DNA-binding protein